MFTTPRNAILGSAVCRFSVDDMESSFEGNFKNQESLTSNWLPMSSSQVSTDPILLRFPFFLLKFSKINFLFAGAKASSRPLLQPEHKSPRVELAFYQKSLLDGRSSAKQARYTNISSVSIQQ